MGLLLSMMLPHRSERRMIDEFNNERFRKMKMLKEECEEAINNNPEVHKLLDSIDYNTLKEYLIEGHVTPMNVFNHFQKKAITVNEDLNCLCEIIERSKEIAIYLTDKYHTVEKRKNLPLYGIPVSIKECELVKGCRNTRGYAFNLNNVSTKDGMVMKVLLDAGAMPFVTTNVPQSLLTFSCSNPIYGVTKNPFNESLTPGGSSGGEAALIAANGSILGIGGDVGGSIRIPAVYSGICGIKPSHLRFCSYPAAGSVPGRPLINASAGPMSKYVDGLVDTCRVFFNASTRDLIREVDPYTVPVPWNEEQFQSRGKTINIGIYTYDGFFECLPAVERAVEDVGKSLQKFVDKENNVKYVIKTFIPPEIPEAFSAFLKAVSVDGGKYLINNFKNDIILPDYRKLLLLLDLPVWLRKCIGYIAWPFSKRFSILASSVPSNPSDLRETYEFIESYRYKFYETMKKDGVDALLLPPNGTHAMPHDMPLEMVPVMSYTGIFNLLDFAAGVISTSKVNETDIEALDYYPVRDKFNKYAKKIGKKGLGLPLGVQIAAPPYKEETVLRIMKDIETILNKSGI
uniref:fatty acid amide hydrolase n=1 Tax=Parastrongyloides trichosuri TaxID=131310 RepID=A0A0N4Z325_PARTI